MVRGLLWAAAFETGAYALIALGFGLPGATVAALVGLCCAIATQVVTHRDDEAAYRGEWERHEADALLLVVDIVDEDEFGIWPFEIGAPE